MYLVERFWAVATTVLSIVSLTPLQDDIDSQVPLPASLPSSLPSSLQVYPPVEPSDVPIFHPPGAPDNNQFTCNYTSMVGWESCSTPLDRKCWLRRKSDGKQFDINTNYEKEWPKGVTRHYKIDLIDGKWDADGLPFDEAKLFDGRYPGPWIQACWGDRLIVNVTNSLSKNGTSVHWHGIRQWNTTHMDGVNGVTQCPIAPGDYFVYNFTLTQYGSSWYHSHYSVQYADGAAGPMTIHGPSSADWDEAISPPLIMSDWYHKSAFYVLTNSSDNGGKDILLNGRGDITKFNCDTKPKTRIKPALNITFAPPQPGKANKRYLLRVINTSFDTTFVFSIDNHILQVASADFVPILPYRNTSILVGIGQRYNVIVEANPTDEESELDPWGNYWIRTQIASCFLGSNQGSRGYDETGILRYNASNKRDPTTKRWKNISLNCSDETYTSLSPVLPWIVGDPKNGKQNSDTPKFGEAFEVGFSRGRNPPKLPSPDYPIATFMLNNSQERIPMRVDYSDPIFLHLDPKDKQQWQQMWRVLPENYTNNDWIYLVIQGSGGSGNTVGAHPIHLHGHDFAILEQAQDKIWNPKQMNLKLINPPRRDVVLLPTNGYVVIAFKADNPGPWLVHCHIATHISAGLGMQIMEDQSKAFKFWPNDDSAIIEANRVCTNWKKWYYNKKNWDNPPKPLGKCPYDGKKEAWCFQDDSGV